MIDFEELEQQEIATITALNLSTYLRKSGWEYQGKRGRNAEIFSLTTDGGRNTVAVPTFELLDDHDERITDAVGVISRAENRPPSVVYRDLARADNDRVRIASTNGLGHAPLTLSNSTDLLDAAYDLMSYSARAAEGARSRNFRAAFRGGLSTQVSSFLNGLAFSPEFLQGYHLTMYSPVPVSLQDGQEPTESSDESPFARDVTQTLAQALEATSEALSTSVRNLATDHFKDVIVKGVSANLCDALSRLAKGGKGVSIEVNWSLLRGSSTPPRSVAITHQHADILRSAADTLRTSEPSIEELVFSHVFRLERLPEEFDGKATLLALRDGRTVRISTEFKKDDYPTVIEAFRSQRPLSLIGDVHQSSPGRLELRNPHDLFLSTQ